jgi:SSS family solute:Na+ symporter
MSTADWIMVVAWVAGTSALGVAFKRRVKTTRDYLLAGRRLSWWQIALAQTADAVDATDFVAITGQGYRTGLSQMGYAWWGMGIGSILLSRYVTPLLYRTGVYTNAEYLELRYSSTLRTVSAVFQTLYRFVAMALVVYAMATMFQVILGIDLWLGVWGAMALTLIYVFTSGQLGVVMAAIPQVMLMLFVSVLVFGGAFWEIGGWRGFWSRAAEFGARLHLAGHSQPGVPGGVYLWGLVLTLVTYPIVNQTVAQRIVAARSELDARKGTIASLIPWCVITGASTLLGIMGVVLAPGLAQEKADTLFPNYMLRYLPPGFLGMGVAALMVASMSTGAGIGTAIAGLMTVDVFRIFGREKFSDRFNLAMTRCFAVACIVCGTCFAMLIPKFGGMIPFYVEFTGTFFLPLTVPYVGGALYRKASRDSGLAALAAGAGLGLILFLRSDRLPVFLGQPQWRPFWVLGAACSAFVVWSWIENAVKGPISGRDLASVLNAFQLGRPASPEQVEELLAPHLAALGRPGEKLDCRTMGAPAGVRWYAHATAFELAALALLIVLMAWWW